MNRITIKEILENGNLNQDYSVFGWVRTKRGSKSIAFIMLNDGTCFNDLQIIIELNPTYTNFLLDLNHRMFDLMTIFSKGLYVDALFKGGWSIKKVLPILVPDLSYSELEISGGTQAMAMWGKMLEGNYTTESSDQIQKDLLEYCKLDTFAMVEIYRFLTKLE